jgi:hypothetical protein
LATGYFLLRAEKVQVYDVVFCSDMRRTYAAPPDCVTISQHGTPGTPPHLPQRGFPVESVDTVNNARNNTGVAALKRFILMLLNKLSPYEPLSLYDQILAHGIGCATFGR